MLALREAHIPRWPFGKVALFASPHRALRHLCDHVFTRPEADYWSHLMPSFRDYLDPSDTDTLFHFARSLWSNHPPWEVVQLLYDEYSRALIDAIHDAVRESWYWAEEEPEGTTYRGLGLNGVYVIWERNVIRTGMLLGYSSPPSPEVTGCTRRTNPLPRQHSWKYRGAALRHVLDEYPPVEEDSQRAVYHVFKKGAVRIRQEFRRARRERRVASGGAYLGTLVNRVPDFDQWQTLRLQPRRLPVAASGCPE
ncbi:MAG: hypothetical protein U0840_06050 [Gemmataceae bacterium]